MEQAEIDELYRRLGEFVVCFQWLEDRFRQIGWIILDPERTEWPPRAFREELNAQLLTKVERLFLELIDSLAIDQREETKADFSSLVVASHELRKRRNVLLHSAYIELKAGGEIQEIMRADSKVRKNASGQLVINTETLTPESMDALLTDVANVAVRVDMHYMGLIHMAPFDHLRRQPPE